MVIFNFDVEIEKQIAAAVTNKRSYSVSPGTDDDVGDDQEPFEWEDAVLTAAKNDNVDNLLKFYDPKKSVEYGLVPWPQHPGALQRLIRSNYINCLRAVIKYVNFTAIDDTGMTVMHYAAKSFDPAIIKLFLENGAPTDSRCHFERIIICDVEEENPYYLMLPLNYALHMIHYYLVYFSILIPEQSVFKMIITLCLPQLRPKLDCVRLLVETDPLGEEIYYYATEGRLVELAILLMVAREKVTSVPLFKGHSMTVRDFVIAANAQHVAQQVKQENGNGSCNLVKKCNERMMSVLLLLEVFGKVGDEIEKYLRQEVQLECNVPEHIARVLSLKGFELKSEDTDFRFLDSFDWSTPLMDDLKFRVEEEYQISQLGNSLTTSNYKNWRVNPVLPPVKTLQDKRSKVKVNDPLDGDLKSLRDHSNLKCWTPKGKSIYELLSILSSTELRNQVDNIKLHAKKSLRILELSCYHARKGDLIELAALLMVAWKKLKPSKRSRSESGSTCGARMIRQCIMVEIESLIVQEMKSIGRVSDVKVSPRLETKKVIMLSALQLLDVFEMAGDAFDQYLQSERNNEIAKDAAGFFTKISSKKRALDYDTRVRIIDPKQEPSEDTIVDSVMKNHHPDFRSKFHRSFNSHLVPFSNRLAHLDILYRMRVTPNYNRRVNGSRSFHTLLPNASSSVKRLEKLAPLALSLGRLLKRV